MTDQHRIKKVAIIGPECTGKSDLSSFLAEHFKTVWVPEYAREYLDNLDAAYQLHDLTAIARGQLRLEEELATRANKVLICDTNLYVIKIWSEVKYGTCDPEILQSLATRKYDLYLLTYVDIPWEEDPYREHPHKRQELFDLYLGELKRQTVPFVIIDGERSARRKKAVDAVETLLGK